MPTKLVTVPAIGTVKLVKRKGNRSIRLSVTSQGDIRVSLPTWLPYQAGINFVQHKQPWISKQLKNNQPIQLTDTQPIGKAHHLRLIPSAEALKITSRLRASEAIVTYPVSLVMSDLAVQAAARRLAIRALRDEAEQLLPYRLKRLAQAGHYEYESVQIKQLKRRWGSCNQQRDIVLNLYLMQLPWSLIDYVLWHELTHTKYLNHGADFWNALTRQVPQAKALRKQIRQYATDVLGGDCY